VSKAEVERYPVIGSGAKATGVIFVHRDKQHSRAAAKKAIQDALESGKSVMLYPEGTTSDLDTTNEFKLGSFKVAAETGYPVVPVAIDYKDPADYWFGTPMLVHFMKKFGKRKTYSSLKIGPLLHGDNALELMRESRGWINNSILEMRANWRNDPG
jgi:1-acyl-sn-glycerol-3-phosphate acyltransferase